MTKRYLVISDTQIPFEDRKAVNTLMRAIGDYQPDEIVHIGDLMDYPQPSRWNKDTRGEFEGSVYEDSEYAKKRFLRPLRAVYDGPIGVLEGNHDLRPREYLTRYAPALAGSHAFDFDQLLDFDGFGITALPEFYKFAPGWLFTHGHRGNISLSRNAGSTALNACNTFQSSVIMGHTHRIGMVSRSFGYAGKVTKTFTGVEVGNLMDMRQAQYLKGGTANWQQGFYVVHVDGQHVRPEEIRIDHGAFMLGGTTYRIGE